MNSILFLGDSLTQYGNWRALFPGLDIRNRGIAGDTTDDGLHLTPEGYAAWKREIREYL